MENPPASREAAEEECADLEIQIRDIQADIALAWKRYRNNDPELNVAEYIEWRESAQTALRIKQARLRQLRAWLKGPHDEPGLIQSRKSRVTAGFVLGIEEYGVLGKAILAEPPNRLSLDEVTAELRTYQGQVKKIEDLLHVLGTSRAEWRKRLGGNHFKVLGDGLAAMKELVEKKRGGARKWIENEQVRQLREVGIDTGSDEDLWSAVDHLIGVMLKETKYPMSATQLAVWNAIRNKIGLRPLLATNTTDSTD